MRSTASQTCRISLVEGFVEENLGERFESEGGQEGKPSKRGGEAVRQLPLMCITPFCSACYY